MARIPLTIYLNVLAGIIVVFNHRASSETGDIALNKVTGAAGRFYTLFHNAVTALCTSHLEITLCGPTLSGFIPHDARLRYCHAPVGRTSDGRELGSSDFAFVYDQPHEHLSRVVWDWSGAFTATIGAFLLRVLASWWWFTAPLKVTGVFLAAYSGVSALDYFLKTNVVLRVISQMYMTVLIDFVQCIRWEGQRHAWDIGVVMMERVLDACQRTWR